MNRYDELYEFKIANKQDLDRLMSFIKTYWRDNHILGNDRDFFIYEHGNLQGDDLNFLICEERSTGEIVGMHGFIPYSYQASLRHVCGVMTMVKKDVAVPMLGVELIKRFIAFANYKTYCGIGTNPKTMVPLVKRLFNRQVGKLTHYYCLNENTEDFKIAKIVNREGSSRSKGIGTDVKLIEMKCFTELKKNFTLNQHYENLPYKEDWYIEKRYFNHPIYKYRVWGLSISGEIRALLVGRVVKVGDAQILRFVDFIGNTRDIAQIGQAVHEIILKESYEYADFLLHGVPESVMNQAGFIKKNEADENIVPNYFEPFVQSNVDIWFETSHENMVLFRADADADRPNYRG